MMIRSFLPVGQGAFYLEQFIGVTDRVNIIYDCGSSTSTEYVEREIKANLEPGETVHAVFISHFDNDHVNGLEFLLKYCNVRKIFIPLVTERNRNVILLKYLLESEKHSTEDFFYKFLDNPYIVMPDRRPDLYQVAEYSKFSNERYEVDRRDIRIIDFKEVNDIILKDINEDNRIRLIEADWEYVPFNFRQEDRIQEVLLGIKLEFGFDVEMLDMKEVLTIRKYRKKLKEIFSRVKGNLNSNSMVLFSGTKSRKIKQFEHYPDACNRCMPIYFHQNFKPCGCLYTGDYNASKKEGWDELVKVYEDYWRYIGCFQVPHHGSEHNYNNKLAKYNAYYVVSAGYNNRYNHPHAKVVKDFLYNRLKLNIVTEAVGSAMRIVVEYM